MDQRVARLSHSLYTVANPEFAGRAVQLSLRLELVPHLPHGEDVAGFGCIRLEFAPQLGHVCIDCPAHDGRTIAPNGAKQLIPACYPTLAAQQRDQQIELLWCQLDPLAVASDGPRS